MRLQFLLPLLTSHMLFFSGKTTIAKRMGLLFHSLGVLGTDKVRVASLDDMVGQFLGQTAPKVKKLFEESVGGVLFIDEGSLNHIRVAYHWK